TPTNKGKSKVLINDKKDNERESNQKEKTEEASNLTHNKAQTYLNTNEILSLKECSTMDYGMCIIQEALISDTSKNAISKRKRNPGLSQEDAKKQAPTLTEKDTAVSSQQITKVSIVPLKDEHSTIKTEQEDIYSSQWAFTRDEMEDTLRGSLSDKTNISSSTQWKMEQRPQPGLRSSSKECSKPSKLFNLGSKPKHRCPHTPNGCPSELMDMDETKLPASDLIQNTPYHDESDLGEASITTQIEIDKVWESFEEGIIFATKRNIPYRIIKGT
ncbi:15715_t:CDS:2, partial [Gigaspora rosea]